MIIRNAQEKDAALVEKIVLELNISRKSRKKTGFVEYLPIPLAQWKKRIKYNPYFYVVEDTRNIVGFLAAYAHDFLKMTSFKHDQLVQYILTKEPPFIYWDQLAIREDYQGKGIGKSLIQHLLKKLLDTHHISIYGPIAHKPHSNIISIHMLKSFGWEQIDKIEVYDGLVFGIYCKKIH